MTFFKYGSFYKLLLDYQRSKIIHKMYNSLFYLPTLTQKKKKPNIVAFINSLVNVDIYTDIEESVTISFIHNIQQIDVYTFERSGGGRVEDFDCVNPYSKL